VSNKYVPYIKYVLAPDTRFERDHEIFFSPKGKVAQGQPLINYGWGYGGLKEFIKAYFEANRRDDEKFELFYSDLTKLRGNILERLASDKILELPLRGLITAKIHEQKFIPILIVDFTTIKFKYCESCIRRWKGKSIPPKIESCLGADALSQKIKEMRCTRMACNYLCGNYRNCILNYTSLEEDPETEKRILDCLSSLLRLLQQNVEPAKSFECREIEDSDERPRSIGPLQQDSKCFERPVRFDFRPIRRRHIDLKTWEEIQSHRVDHGAHHIIDLIPSNFLPDVFEDQTRRVDVNAPLEAEGVLESFMKIADIKLEIKVDFISSCDFCGGQHCLSKVPISAMFKTDQAYIQEAGFGKVLWKLLWKEFPEQMCKTYPKVCRITDSPIFKRELKASTLGQDGGNLDYDYAVNLEPLTGDAGWLLFDLTTGLWKKGGFHESGIKPEEYVKRWKETLVRIPSDYGDAKSMWYVVVPTTEEQFFSDEITPVGIDNTTALLTAIADHNQVFNPLIIFNSTPRKGEARTELRNLAVERRIQQTRVYPATEKMLEEMK
jgi:hypothetical protein